MHICLITSRIPPIRCGVGDYTVQLADALHTAGMRVTILTGKDQVDHLPNNSIQIRNVLSDWRARGMIQLVQEITRLRPDRIIIQWVPFLYDRFGVNIWLPFTAAYLRLMGYFVQMMVHELWVPLNSWQYRITGPLQRLLLSFLILVSNKIAVSTTGPTRMLQSFFPWRRRDIYWVPVGSNIPVVEITPVLYTQLRMEAGIAEQALVLALFSPFGAGKGLDLIESCWQQIADKDVQLIVIGATAAEATTALPQLATDKRVKFLGYLEPSAVSCWLQNADLLLAPFIDGMSARRTSALAALAHGLAVVSTRGPLFDEEIFGHGALAITDYDSTQFTAAVQALIQDATRRHELAVAARVLFTEYFSWPAIVARLLGEESVKIS
ncbi:MAG: glycosyltransferase family 4 protein [Acidobacteriota bacterium]